MISNYRKPNEGSALCGPVKLVKQKEQWPVSVIHPFAHFRGRIVSVK